ncbi:hypothetical protein TH53_25360 [Pedobacter lusitanus]|uniref:DUF2784 domain-containing protein n=1 Tax=Pedobacter lusitanus TaxID=1503925 RepID=A0A0D0EZ16_9SPHI|nr:DUF2784 domain-containing protein [Pedobacter lusitanus]KIO74628.1 hypothetical protein TH53_25360 [Pedobacter lusitanus]
MMILLDWLFTLLHLIIIGFNLFGWIWPATRKAHLLVVALTLSCWLILGIWYGIGYCPVTDWQWQIKEKLGETDLPNSFVKYYADKISGQKVSSSFIDAITAISFAAAIMMTVYVNFIKKRLPN